MAKKRRLRAKNRFGVVVPIDIAAEDVTMNNGNNAEQEIDSIKRNIDALEEAVDEGSGYDIRIVGDAIVINSRSNPRVIVGEVGNNNLSSKAGNTATTSFYVSGRNLTDDIEIDVDDSTNWEVDTESISPTNGKVAQTLVTITYQPASGTTAGTTQNCTVTISSTGATSSTIAMTGTVVAAPTITLTMSSATITTTQGTSATATLNVKGAALEGDISLAISGTGFTLSANSVAQADAESSAGADITVTFDGSAAGSATITASSTNASNATASVVGALQAVLNATLNYVVRTDGSVESRADTFYTDTIPMSAGQTLVFNGHANTNTSAIFTEANGTKTMVKNGGTTANLTAYTYTAGENCNVGVSGWKIYGDESVTLDGVNVPINNLVANTSY